MSKLKKSDLFLLIFLLILVVLTVLFVLHPEWGEFFSLADWVDKESADYDFKSGLYIVAIACFLGALVPFPVPYIIVVSLVALQYVDNNIGIMPIILMVIVATVTNSIGDFVDWLIGRGGGHFAEKSGDIDGKVGKKLEKAEQQESPKKEYDNKWAKLVYDKPALIPVLLILFGLTPLPDSLLFMPLGVINYSLKKTMLWNAFGKLLMMSVCALLGIFVFDWFFGLLGGSGGEYGWVTGMVTLFLSWLIMAVMIKSG
ncbi:MAG: hypothetical protein GF364_10795 [Candidatus Lokiarchaeota archaeon]|nr:hypothetical protein [Candidatus Lokiarchaeota archaeon]